MQYVRPTGWHSPVVPGTDGTLVLKPLIEATLVERVLAEEVDCREATLALLGCTLSSGRSWQCGVCVCAWVLLYKYINYSENPKHCGASVSNPSPVAAWLGLAG